MAIPKIYMKLNLPNTPVETITEIVISILSNMMVDYSSIIDLKTRITDIFNTQESKNQVLIEINKIFCVEISYSEYENCNIVYDLIYLIKRKINTVRMHQTPIQYSSISNIKVPAYHVRNDNRSNTVTNIVPFNKVFCRNCFLNIVYSSLSHFEIEPYWFLSKEIFNYSFIDNRMYMPELVNNRSNLLPDFGISVSKIENTPNIIESIIKSIDKGCPVVSSLDCFYTPNRRDTYLSDHAPHYILLYGYDNKKQLLDTIDHDYNSDLKYKKTNLYYQDYFNAFYSYYKWFSTPELFSVNQRTKCPKYSLEEIRHEFVSFFKANSDIIMLGNESIILFKKYCHKLLKENRFFEETQNVISSIDICVNRKATETYLYDVLFEDSELSILQNKIKKKWQTLGITLRLDKKRNDSTMSFLTNFCGLLEQLFNLEMEKTYLITNSYST